MDGSYQYTGRKNGNGKNKTPSFGVLFQNETRRLANSGVGVAKGMWRWRCVSGGGDKNAKTKWGIINYRYR